jgi:hypothetical protein
MCFLERKAATVVYVSQTEFVKGSFDVVTENKRDSETHFDVKSQLYCFSLIYTILSNLSS